MRIFQGSLAALASVVALGLQAAPGITASEILVGQDIDMSGPIAVRMKPLMEAADAYLEKVNAAGGVNGRKIRIVRLDSGNKPEKTRENIQAFEKQGVFAMWA